MYKIGELSKLCNISVKTLRYYDAEGLLVPDHIDKFTGYRYYSASKLSECYRIIALKELGFSLEAIRTQLSADSDDVIASALDAKLEELRLLSEATQQRMARITYIKSGLLEGDSKMFNIIIRATDEIRVAYVRKEYASKTDAVEDADRRQKCLPKGIIGKRKVIINYETEYKDTNFDLAACVEISEKLPKNSPYGEKLISLGALSASLVCSPQELDDAYQAMIKHLDATGHKACGAYYEIYHPDGTVELKVPVKNRSKEPLYRMNGTEKPFVDDPEVCGKWKMLDIIPTREHFVYGKPKCNHLAWLNELYFIDGGTPYWAVCGWTKGCLYTSGPVPNSRYANKYTVERLGGRKLLFLETYDYCDGDSRYFGAPEIWVYEQVEERHYTSQEEFRRCDNIDYPFVPDQDVLGVWKVRDFLIRKEDFDADKQNWPADQLFALSVEFKENGIFVQTTKDGTNATAFFWTKGLVLCKSDKTAGQYEIQTINGKEYLFYEWKTGDYCFGGGRSYWYVFTRE